MRLIDADALREGIACHKQYTDQEYETDRQWALGYNAGIERALFSITYAHAIDAEPVRHGRWVWFENRPVTDADDPECIGCTGYECSECGNNEGTCIRFYEELSPDMLARIKEGLMEYLTNYCPNCGAMMGGGAEDGN